MQTPWLSSWRLLTGKWDGFTNKITKKHGDLDQTTRHKFSKTNNFHAIAFSQVQVQFRFLSILFVAFWKSNESQRKTVFRHFKDLYVPFFSSRPFFRMISFHFELQSVRSAIFFVCSISCCRLKSRLSPTP